MLLNTSSISFPGIKKQKHILQKDMFMPSDLQTKFRLHLCNILYNSSPIILAYAQIDRLGANKRLFVHAIKIILPITHKNST